MSDPTFTQEAPIVDKYGVQQRKIGKDDVLACGLRPWLLSWLDKNQCWPQRAAARSLHDFVKAQGYITSEETCRTAVRILTRDFGVLKVVTAPTEFYTQLIPRKVKVDEYFPTDAKSFPWTDDNHNPLPRLVVHKEVATVPQGTTEAA